MASHITDPTYLHATNAAVDPASVFFFSRLTVNGKMVLKSRWGNRDNLYLGLGDDEAGGSRNRKILKVIEENNKNNVMNDSKYHIEIEIERFIHNPQTTSVAAP